MPNRETVRALVSAFNVHNYARNTVKTNFTLQSRYGENCIVVSFDKGMGRRQRNRYLNSIKRKIVGEFYGIEEGDTDEVVLNTANLIFNIESFPFNTSKGKWSQDEQGRIEFLAPIDKGVIFNLKSHLASSLEKDVLEDMQISSTTVPVNKGKYLCCSKFDNKELSQQFESKFLSRMRERYENVPKKPLEVKGNSVYIKDVFNDARFIDSVTRYKAWLVGMYLGVDSSANHKVKLFKDMIIESIGQSTGVTIYGFVCASPLGKEEASILIPLVLDGEEKRILTNEEALELNCTFNCSVFYDLYGRTQGKLSINESSGMYSINFSNPYISHCVINKIIKNSVINKDHELAIDPELPRTLLAKTSPTQEFPKRVRSQGAVRRPPRQGSEREGGKGGLFQLVPGKIDSSQSTGDQSQLSLGAGEGMLTEANIWDQKRSSSIPSPRAWDSSTFLNPGVSEDSPKDTENICNEEHKEQKVTKEKEEEKLFKALLYWFNLNNYALDPPHTNFIVKNGKIASLIDDSVDVKEYLEEIIDKTKEEYRVNKKEACDLNEFPFKFLSSCEENQETTVVANISRGALLNLKELFSREHEGKVEIKDIDINIVEKAVKSEKDKWVNFQVQEHGLSPKKAIKTCYPDESVLEYISITKDKGGYWINRDYDGSEVESFRKEKWPAKGISKAEKMKPEDNKDSGYSSGFVTDAENVSSKAEETTSGYESMDCENTRGGSPKRKSPEPLAGSSTTKKTRSESDSSSFEGGVGSPRPGFSGSTIEQAREQLNKTGI